ncbi:MAG TPA: HAMP domain-containing sensor histidine kinase [Polyangiaceae bacterium]|jgi:signal transduction histidine kinase
METTVRAFLAAFGAIALAFVGSTISTEMESSRIDNELTAMELNSMPSVESLMAARGDLRNLQIAVLRYVGGLSPGDRAANRRFIEDERQRFDQSVARELQTPDYPQEHERVVAAEHAIGTLEAKIDGWLLSPPTTSFGPEFEVAFTTVDAALTGWMEVNVENGRREFGRVRVLRSASMRAALLLDCACLVLVAIAAGLVVLALNRQRKAEGERQAALQARASDLEMFAKRVAHDLRSPLSAAAFSLSTIREEAASGRPVDEDLGLAEAALRQAQELVQGAFDFARSGRPADGGRCPLRGGIQAVLDEMRMQPSSESVALVLEACDDAEVRCAPGVLASILSNLVGNAVKFTAPQPEPRRVTVRAFTNGAHVRVEIEDTGPGIPEGYERSIFDPYIRAHGEDRPGLGLGLSTVLRFVEAHGGKLGMHPARDRGSVFWFELPTKASPSSAPSSASIP